MKRFQAPAVPDELAREPVKQFGMRRGRAGRAEIARRGHQAASEVMLPKAVDDDAREQAARAVVRIRDPVRQGRAPLRRARIRRCWLQPMLLLFRRAHEHAQETLRRLTLLLREIAALEQESLLKRGDLAQKE